MWVLARAARGVLAVAWRTGPLAFLLAFGEVASTVLRFALPLVVGWLLNSILHGDIGAVIAAALVLGVSLAIGAVAEAIAVSSRVRLIDDVGFAYDRALVRALSHVPSLDALESPRLAAAISRIKDRADAMGYCYNGLMSVIIQLAAPLTSIVIAAVIDPRLLLLTIAAVPLLLVARKANAVMADAEDASQADVSAAGAWGRLIDDEAASAERKVFRLWAWYTERLTTAVGNREASLLTAARFESRWSAVGEVFYAGCLGATLVWMAISSPDISAGAVASALLVGLDLRGALGALRFALSGLGPGLRAAVALEEVKAAAEDADATTCTSPAISSEGELVLSGVAYTYADGTSALRDISLRIEPGTVVAVVGENGAGKSTLIELILGLRAASEGTSVLPGGQQSVVSQRFARLEFTLSESVALQRLVDDADGSHVGRALERVSARPFWTSFDNGLVQQLGARWPGGRDLSEGQWQTVAGARGFYADALLLALDEATSALDPEAQSVVIEKYMRECRRVTAEGGIALVVTHSMAIPHQADVILVLEGGSVVEQGTHAELLEHGGLYATAYAHATEGFREAEGGM